MCETCDKDVVLESIDSLLSKQDMQDIGIPNSTIMLLEDIKEWILENGHVTISQKNRIYEIEDLY